MNGVLIQDDNDDVEYVVIVPANDQQQQSNIKVAMGSANLLNALDEIERKRNKPTKKIKQSTRTVTLSASPFWKTNDYWSDRQECWNLQHPFFWAGLKENERISKVTIAACHLSRAEKQVDQKRVKSSLRIYGQETLKLICVIEWSNMDMKTIESTNIVNQPKDEMLLGIELSTSKDNVDMKVVGAVYACSIEVEKLERNNHHHKSPKVFRMTDNIITKF